ncbi:MAG: zinc-ribbon domain-containing protein [Pseudobutyrivibrio sp.]|nr:zinc-ribbon domain-containing protein [Pseudobutyrivibrio sp.]
MFCSKCGHAMADGTKFCPKCGNPTSAAKMAQAAPVAPTPVPETPVAQEIPAAPVVEEKVVEENVAEEFSDKETNVENYTADSTPSFSEDSHANDSVDNDFSNSTASSTETTNEIPVENTVSTAQPEETAEAAAESEIQETLAEEVTSAVVENDVQETLAENVNSVVEENIQENLAENVADAMADQAVSEETQEPLPTVDSVLAQRQAAQNNGNQIPPFQPQGMAAGIPPMGAPMDPKAAKKAAKAAKKAAKKAKGGKKKGLVIFLVVLILLIILAAVGFVLCKFGPLKKYFRTPEEILMDSMVGTSDEFFNTYGNIYDVLYTTAYNEGEGVSSEAEVNIALEDPAKILLESSPEYSGVDISWLNTIKITATTSVNSDYFGINGILNLNDQDIGSMDIYADYGKEYLYFQSPELSEKYLGLPIDSTDGESIQEAFNIASAQAAESSENTPSGDELKELSAKYAGIIAENISGLEKGKGTCEAQGVSQSCTTISGPLTNYVDAKVRYNLYKEFINDAQMREALRVIMTSSNAMDEMTSDDAEEFDFDTYYDDLVEEMSDQMVDLRQVIKDCEKNDSKIEDIGEIEIFIDKNDTVVGFDWADDDRTVEYYYYKPMDGDSYGLRMGAKQDGVTLNEVTGSGEEFDTSLTGTFSFVEDDLDVASLEIVTLDKKALEDDTIDGEFKLTYNNLDLDDISSVLAGTLTFDVDATITAETRDFTIGVLSGDTKYLTITSTAKQTTAGAQSAPAADQVIDASTEDGIYEYLFSMNMTDLVSNLKTAGVPEEYTTTLDLVNQCIVDEDYLSLIMLLYTLQEGE